MATLLGACAMHPGFAQDPALPGAAGVTQPLRGEVIRRAVASDPELQYYLYVPRAGAPGAPVFVTVHGISRNAKEHAQMFAPLAETYGVVLVAPRFPKSRFPDYQRLRSDKGTGRSDLALERVLADVAQLTGARTENIRLFGYSGGGQFVHRYAMARPERVSAYVVGAAGWYTFPDPKRKYPRGLRGAEAIFGGPLDPERFLAIPAAVMVGERDVHPGTALRMTPRVEDQQGATRFERGRRWVEAMSQAAREAGLDTRYEFVVLPRSPHSFSKSMRRGAMGAKVFDYLFGPAPAGAADVH